MKRWRLILRSLWYFRATHAGVILGIAVGTAVLAGALLVGDSVRATLRGRGLARLGSVEFAMATGEGSCRSALADALERELRPSTPEAVVAPVLRFRAIASAGGGSQRALDVRVLGVDERFFALGGREAPWPAPAAGELYLNAALAHRLQAEVGERIVLRVEAPTSLPREALLGSASEAVRALPLELTRILAVDEFGDFDLRARQLAPRNAFVSLAWLQEALSLDARANLCLIGGVGVENSASVEDALRAAWTAADLGLRVEPLGAGGVLELTSERILLDAGITDSISALQRPALGVFTYLANELRHGERSIPYSLVSAVGSAGAQALPDGLSEAGLEAPALGAEELLINSWVAEDLEARAGDVLDLSYWKLDARGALVEETRRFRVRAVVPIAGLAADRSLMPPFPGMAESQSCRAWDVGLPIDNARLRERDEDWWREHGGTPKAFLSLATGQELWGDPRFGAATAIRFEGSDPEQLLGELAACIDPGRAGLAFEEVRTRTLAASTPANDFSSLFLSLSSFLLFAAFLLVGLLIALGLLQRSAQLGTLRALGFRPALLRRLYLGETALLAVVGVILGLPLGVGYARVVLLCLETVWNGAVAGESLTLFLDPFTLAAGGLGSLAVALVTAWFTLRRQVARATVDLLAQRAGVDTLAAGALRRARHRSAALAVVAGLGALAASLWCVYGDGRALAATSFGAGTLVLVALLAAIRLVLLGRPGRRALALRTLIGLAWSNLRRRPGRSLAAILLLACGTFLILSVGANRKLPPSDPSARSSGTGGFALLGHSSLAVLPERGDPSRERGGFALSADPPGYTAVVPLRVREGDDASCLNLSRPQRPRVLGVRPEELASRGAFRFARAPDMGEDNPWLLLERSGEPNVIPAIGDEASVTWSLHCTLGDRLAYVDEHGEPFELEIVATLADSILQGSLLIAEEHFVERFPSESGYRQFLVDAPVKIAPTVATTWMSELADSGLELESTSERLLELNAVQNTYILVFQVLGGLGLLLGSFGLGVVVLRNVRERRSELAALGMLGFCAARVRTLLFLEHALLLVLGVACGSLAGLVAILPLLSRLEGEFPIELAMGQLGAMLACGLLCLWLASLSHAVSGSEPS